MRIFLSEKVEPLAMFYVLLFQLHAHPQYEFGQLPEFPRLILLGANFNASFSFVLSRRVLLETTSTCDAFLSFLLSFLIAQNTIKEFFLSSSRELSKRFSDSFLFSNWTVFSFRRGGGGGGRGRKIRRV